MAIQISVLKESASGERRVSIDPSVASRLYKQQQVSFTIQSGAGSDAGFPDKSYQDVKFATNLAATVKDADISIAVMPLTVEDAKELPEDSVLICQIYPHLNQDLVSVLLERKITTFAMELIPRITRAQAMDVLSSQATISGYKAALLAAQLSPRLFPMLTTAAGTIRPSKVVVIGAGVAGLQAIATARRLGGQVEGYDIRPAAKEQVESLGAKMIDTGVNAEGEGGYARELTDDEKKQQADVLAQHLAQAHAVISTAAIPGRPAPKIITKEMVDNMLPGAVIVDMAAETGGNCELTKPGETIEYNDVIIHGPLNLPSTGAVHASEMYSKNVLNLLNLMLKDNELAIDFEDDVIAGCLLTRSGKITHEVSAALLGKTTVVDATPEVAAEGMAVFLDEPNGKPDDLKLINGIGPKISDKLNDMGIFHFQQVSALASDDIKKIENALSFKGRIEREDWIEQAKKLVGGDQ